MTILTKQLVIQVWSSIWAANLHLRVISIHMVFRATGLDEATWEGVQLEKRRGPGLSLETLHYF